jgi:hypothetical protein
MGILFELVMIYPNRISHSPKKSPPTPQALASNPFKSSIISNLSPGGGGISYLNSGPHPNGANHYGNGIDQTPKYLK